MTCGNINAYARIMAGDTVGAKTILHAWPTHPDALRMLGQLEASRGNDTVAYHLFVKAVEVGASPSLFVDLAGVQMLQQHYAGVLRTISTYAKLVPEMPADMYCNAGIAEKETGNLVRSLDFFEKGFAKYPADALLRYNLGQLYFYYHRYTDAQRVWANMADTLQKDPTLAYMQAISARQNNDLNTAEMYIRSAIKLGNKAEYHDFLGQLLFMQGRKDDAAASFKTALTINPQLMSAQLHRALLSDSHKEQDTAVAALTRQLKACKHLCSDIALRLAAILYKQGNAGRAADVLWAIPDDDQTLDVQRYAAFCFRELGEWGKSAVLFERAKQRFVLDPLFEYTWAQDYIMAGDYSKAIESFVDVLGRYTDNPWQIYYQIGYSYMQLNDRVKAEQYFLQSISYKEDNPPARGYLALYLCSKRRS